MVCSADHFFTDPVTGSYVFNKDKLTEAHAACQEKFRTAVEEEGRKVVIVDNTHVQRWEINFYFKTGNKAG